MAEMFMTRQQRRPITDQINDIFISLVTDTFKPIVRKTLSDPNSITDDLSYQIFQQQRVHGDVIKLKSSTEQQWRQYFGDNPDINMSTSYQDYINDIKEAFKNDVLFVTHLIIDSITDQMMGVVVNDVRLSNIWRELTFGDDCISEYKFRKIVNGMDVGTIVIDILTKVAPELLVYYQ